jgi:hypothetical protein
VLDEIVAGLRLAPDHVAACEACQQQLTRARSEAALVRELPEFQRTFERLRPQPAKISWLARWALPGIGLFLSAAAATLVLVVHPGSALDQVKGAPSLALLRSSDAAAQAPLRSGEHVRLSVGAAGHPYLLVVALDETGRVDPIWPSGKATSGKAPSGGVSALEPGFEVTPGSFLLYAVFSDVPLETPGVRRALKSALEQHRRTGQPLWALNPGQVPGESGHAKLYVSVAR